MANFFKTIFNKITGGGNAAAGEAEKIVKETLEGVVQRAGLDLDFNVSSTDEAVDVEFTGADAELLTQKEGLLLDSFQFFLKRVVQHQLPESRIEVNVDSSGFRESSTQELVELANRLRDLVLEKSRPVFVRSLPPRDRKVIHRHLADDTRIKCRSVGEGLYKKIKITLNNDSAESGRDGSNDPGQRSRRGGRGRRQGGRRPNRTGNGDFQGSNRSAAGREGFEASGNAEPLPEV